MILVEDNDMRKKKSFREIARLCSVSPATVSRIANGIGSFSDETKRLVTGYLQEEGYTLTAEDESPARKIGIVITDLTNDIFCKIATVMESTLREKQYLVPIFTEKTDQEEITRRMIAASYAGIIYLGNARNNLRFDSLIPAIHIFSPNEVLYKGQRYSVSSDEYVGGQLAARELLKKNCRNPLVLNNRYIRKEESPRIQGFLSEFENAGINRNEITIYDGDITKSAFNSAKDVISYLWAKGCDYDSIYGCSDWRAYGAIVVLRSMNIRIPEDVKVIGFDGFRLSKYCEQPFTTIQQNPEIIAEKAVEMMLDLIAGKKTEASVTVPIQVQVGLTV